MTTPANATLTYTIAQSTPHSGRYSAENILVDKPQDQSSRWSGAFQGNARQWILLKLESLAVLKSITFGKFSKPHPCNMKEFKVYVGVTEDNMTQALHAGLKNDLIPETFALKHVNSSGVVFPTRFVKIEPLGAHGQSFHISIWHVSMKGIKEPSYIQQIRANYEEFRETTVLRHILKHLRQRRLLSPYQSIISRSNLQLEHPLTTQLHESIVLQGDWPRAEQLLTSLSDSGLFNTFLYACQPHAVWKRLTGTDPDGDAPSPRGGHAMCMDPINEMIYMFGGWDGQKSLDDFWVYSVKEDKWRILSHGTSEEHNAPGARSCHKMVFDTKTGSIYLLGRLNDLDVKPTPTRTPAPTNTSTTAPGNAAGPPTAPQQQSQQPQQPQQQATPPVSQASTPRIPTTRTYCSEFYRYQTRGVDAGKWVFLSFDTASSGGPPLIFDHQMVMDNDSQILYVFGGRVVDGDWDTSKYSGLYSYNVRLSKWKLLQHPDNVNGSHVIIPSRFGHSMVLEPNTKQLFIFGGQRDERYLSDMYSYDLNTNTATELFSNFSTAGGPDACFTQRTVIDPTLKEMYVFCGLTRNSAAGSQNTTLRSYLSNWVYRYDTKPGKWTQILRHSDSHSADTPLPRFAHQVVYNPNSRAIFLHGGNAGGLSSIEKSSINPDPAGGSIPTSTGREASENSNPDGDGTKAASPPSTREKRLDDFWKMELRRPGVEEVLRRVKFHIRRQQFREMCEDASPVKALQFLQTEVSCVVDHKSSAEAEIFRSLLTHLLAPSTQSRIPILPRTESSSSIEDSYDSHSHPNQGSMEAKSEEGESWTNELPDDSSSPQPYPTKRGTADVLRGIVDPVELNASNRNSAGPNPASLTSMRYKQRSEVFENLLEFISEAEKEPVGDLLDMIGQDGVGG